jgi:carboxyl-terminal processing protease
VKKMKKFPAPFLRAFLLSILIFCSCLTGARAGLPLKTGDLEYLAEKIRSEFYKNVDLLTILNGGLLEVKKALQAAKKSDSQVTLIPEDTPSGDQARLFNEQIDKILSTYEDFNKTTLIYAALQGMLESLQDEYSVFLNPSDFSRLQESLSHKSFGGLGIYIELDPKNNKQLTVVEPIEGSPAFKAGIKHGDMILKINGVSTRGITLEEAQNRMRGPVGTRVTLTLRSRPAIEDDLLKTPARAPKKQNSLKEGTGKKTVPAKSQKSKAGPVRTIRLTRAEIHVKSIAKEKIIDGGIGYIRLRSFGENVMEELRATVDSLLEKGARSFILDLRNNGGGYMMSAVDLCTNFLPTGSPVVTVLGKNTSKAEYVSGENRRPLYPMAVLVNQFSASASEISAGAIQDQGFGRIIGTTTFGKARVQNIFPLSDGSAIKITSATYVTPKGRDINKRGIDPDDNIPMDLRLIGTPKDVQLARAVSCLRETMAKKPLPAKGPVLTSLDEGGSEEDAIRVKNISEEMDYIKTHVCTVCGGKFVILSQNLVSHDGLFFDHVEVQCPGCPGKKTLIFDLSEFFGKIPK